MSLDENKQPDLTGEPEAATPAPAKIEYDFGEPAEPTSVVQEDDRFSAFDRPTEAEKPQEKTKKVSKRTRTLILTSAAALILAAAVLVVTLFPFSPADGGSENSGTSSDTPSVEDSIVLIDKTVETDKDEEDETVEVTQMTVTNKDDSYTLVYNTKDKVYQLKGYEDLTLNASGANSMADCAAYIEAAAKVKVVENLADFGLDKPQATFTGTYHDGSTATLSVGKETPSGNSYYVSLQGDDNVYICSSSYVSYFTMTGASFVNTTLLSTPTVKSDDPNGTPTLREVTLTGRSHPVPLTLRRSAESDNSTLALHTYIITAPYKRGVSETVSNELTTFTSLSASEAAVLHPTAADKKKYGFDDPLTLAKVTLSVCTTKDTESEDGETATTVEYYNTTKATVTIGSKDASGNYYVMMEGINAIFLVSSASLSMVAERTYDNTVNTLLFLKDITTVKQINVGIAGKQHKLTLKHYPDEEDRDKSLVVSEGDKSYITSDFRTLYQLMMGLDRYQPLKKTPTGTPALELELIDENDEVYLSASFYEVSGSIYHARTSEGETFTIKASKISHFIKQMDNFLNGKDVLVTV